MAKKVNMKVIEQDTKKYKEFIELPLDSQGEEYIIKIYPYFSPTKVSTMMKELTSFLKIAEDEKVNVPNEDFDDLLGYFIVRNFTDISMTKSKKAKTIFEEFNLLRNSVLFELILKSIPEESLEYVHTKVFELIEFSAKFEKKVQQLRSIALQNQETVGINKEVQ